MNVGLYQSAASLSALERWQDAVAQNITSNQVTGYKKQTVQLASYYSGEIQGDESQRVGDGGATPVYYPAANLGISFANGENMPTRRDFDFALGGPGFFQLQAEDGRTFYTRNGSFATTPELDLVNHSGFAVLGDGGNPIKLQPGGGAVTVDTNGQIRQNGAIIGQMEIVRFENNHALVDLGGGLFAASEGQEPEVLDEPDILQGHLEQANIQPLREMVDLVSIARAYEANQKIISHRDELMKQTLEKLG
ncbi:flagellar hook-basal body protein [Actomonas aquatica]|uniref:Flagellar hook basal-body protein n=1 Tax=Actomonas aquatica TaxID=2866162 RepID=A0ABZ1C809_9BACT|nr:flagellar hook basal-body protein [Opitutus sp. WL0086]WRQ87601.1 flagellar hook basal-body protein [Opitutus sp. WL0086]